MATKYQLEDAKVVPRLTPSHYTSMWPNHLSEETAWFRQYFIGNPYITLIGPLSHDDDNHSSTALGLTTAALENDDDDLSYAIITVVQENRKPLSTFGDNSIAQGETNIDNEHSKTTKATGLVSTTTTTGPHYRLIIRNKEKVIRCVVSEETARNTLTRLEALGQGDRLTSSSAHRQKQKQKRRPLRSFSSAIIHHTTNSLSSSSSPSLQQRCQQQDCYHNNEQGIDDHVEDDDDDAAADHDDSTTTTLHHCYSQQHHHQQSIQRSSHESYRLLHAAVLSIYHHLDLQQFKTLTAETTIMTGLEKGLLRFDEMEVSTILSLSLLLLI